MAHGLKNATYLEGEKVYEVFRRGLVHRYFIKHKSMVNMGWIIDQPIIGYSKLITLQGGESLSGANTNHEHVFEDVYIFQVPPYFDAFKRACEKFHREVIQGENPKIMRAITGF